ncbi:uncharacterized protein [Haliotis asinina]|uniref:uncharacterized protein n=1 Tax=Haliotis asinina TaxID=109174 RepID=UPI0035319A9E
MYSSGLLPVLLVLSLARAGISRTLDGELLALRGQLQTAKADFRLLFNITNDQCPCTDGAALIGNESIADVGCFAAKLEVLNRLLCDLTLALQNVTELQPDVCPKLEGCAGLVAACSSSDVAVVDSVGTILPSLHASENVSGLTVDHSAAGCPGYVIYYFTQSPFLLICWVINGTGATETVIANETILAEISGLVTGVAYHTNNVYVAVDYVDVPDVLLSVETISPFTVTPLTNLTCKPGRVRYNNGRIFFSDCKTLKSVDLTGGDERIVMQYSLSINAFDVLDNDTIIFCDAFGGLWHYNPITGCFRLMECKTSPCADVRQNQCSLLIYVAYPDTEDLDVFESSLVANGTLAYTTSVPGACPTIDFEPNCARPIDGVGY